MDHHAAVGVVHRGQPRSRARTRSARRRSLRSREGEGPDHRVPRGREAAQGDLRADPLLRGAARGRQDVARTFDRKRAGTEVRAALGRRRARRVGDPRSSPHLHRRDAGLDHPLASRRRVSEPARADRRDRQAGQRLARRPGQRNARGARPGAELDVPRPLSRSAVRPLEDPLHLHGEHARHDPRATARPDGRDPALRLHRRREARHRQALPAAEADPPARPAQVTALALRHDAARGDPRVHPGGGRPQFGAPARGYLPQGGDPGCERQREQAARRRQASARVAGCAALLGRGPQAHIGARCRDGARLHGRGR